MLLKESIHFYHSYESQSLSCSDSFEGGEVDACDGEACEGEQVDADIEAEMAAEMDD